FGDSTISNAILDRLLHHSHVIKITGNSYRTKGKIETTRKE
ncbi:MAG: ATP-binding protein, partial [Vallitalea sp.]|nr:ATP-binding protein [Vallitalea sp.]